MHETNNNNKSQREAEFARLSSAANKKAVKLPKEAKKKVIKKVVKNSVPKPSGKYTDNLNFLHSRALPNYLSLVSNPFGNETVRSTVNYNPVPTLSTTLARTKVLRSFTVTSGTAVEISLFGGHGANDQTLPQDGTSYHARKQTINGVAHQIGPMDSTGGVASCCGYIYTGLGVNACATGTNVAACAPLLYDNSLPYKSQESEGMHTRWKLLAMGLRLINTTPTLTRGGVIRSVQPYFRPIGLTTQSQHDCYQTFQECSACDPVEVDWIPSPQDMAFWHSVNAGDTNTESKRLSVWIVAPSGAANDQTYDLQVVCHWELGGTSLTTVSGGTAHYPVDKNLMEPILDQVMNSQPTSSNILEVAKHVGNTILGNPSKPPARQTVFREAETDRAGPFMKTLFDTGASVVKHLAKHL